MAVPKWHEFLIPVLRVLETGEARQRRDVVEEAAGRLNMAETDRNQMLPSGQLSYVNRASWAITHLNKADAITSPLRAHWQITDEGRKLLVKFPNGMNEHQLREDSAASSYSQFVGKQVIGDNPSLHEETDQASEETPLEQVEIGQRRNEKLVGEELLKRLHKSDPVFFEQAVLDLLMAMGYGGSFGKATRTQLVNDRGIDGVIDQDALGLSRIYIQAKRYEMSKSILRPDIQGFVGALHGAQANQGVFLTTASFSTGAIEYAETVQSRVVLIDGPLLAQLMIRHGVGVQVKRTVHIVEIDEDFFE